MEGSNDFENKGKTISPEMAKILESSGFFLLKSINSPKDTNIDIDLTKIKNLDNQIKSNTKNNRINESNNESKINFIKDIFYNGVLSIKENKINFENIHKETDFKMLQNEDRNNSSIFYPLNLISKLKGSEELERIENNINTQFNSLTKYQKENISIITSPYKLDEKYNDFNFYRKVKANGNSFYISFMYQYFKNLIINHNEKEISYIFNIQKELNLINTSNNNNELNIPTPNNFGHSYFNESLNKIDLNINYISAFIYLYLIYQKTVDNKIDEALYYLNYSSSYEELFVDLLCKYMRYKIKRFIIINKDIFTYEKYCIRNKLISEGYFDEDNLFQFEKYIKENIIVDYMEPSLFIISIIPYVFNINLNLFIKEKNTYGEQIDYLCDKIVLNSDKNMINILYTSYSYHIIQMEKTINSYIENHDLSNIFNLTDDFDLMEKEEHNYIMFIDKDINEKCNKCKGNKFIRLANISKNEICLNCLKNTIDEVFEQRYLNMLNENFKYIEFYLRDIALKYLEDINKYIYLTSAEFYFLFHCNKFTYFRKLIGNICDSCGNNQKNNKIIKKKCGCKRCIKCAKTEIKNNILINEFEKAYVLKNKIIKCKCGEEMEEFEYSSRILNILKKDEKENLEIKSKVRIKNYIQIYFMICGEKLIEIDKNKNKKKIKIYNKYNFKNFNNETIPHLICEKCNKDFEKDKPSIFCIICHEIHENNEYIFSINNIQKENTNNNNNIIQNDSTIVANNNNSNNNLNIKDKEKSQKENKNNDGMIEKNKEENKKGKINKNQNQNQNEKRTKNKVLSKSTKKTNKIKIDLNTNEDSKNTLNRKNQKDINKKGENYKKVPEKQKKCLCIIY